MTKMTIENRDNGGGGNDDDERSGDQSNSISTNSKTQKQIA